MYLIFTWYFLLYSKMHYYTEFKKVPWNYGRSNPWGKPYDLKWSDDSCLHENEERWSTCTVCLSCLVDAMNKQLLCPPNWNNSLLNVAAGKSYILITHRCVDVKAKHFLDVDRIHSIWRNEKITYFKYIRSFSRQINC